MSSDKKRHRPIINRGEGETNNANDVIPDVRDGLTRLERVILYELHRLQQERPGRSIPSIQLYGRVAEHLDCSPQQVQAILEKLTQQ